MRADANWRWKWLSNVYVLKILTGDFSNRVKNMELEASKRIRSAGYRQEGSNHVRTVRESFEVDSPMILKHIWRR